MNYNTYAISVSPEELLPHMKAALATSTYGLKDEDAWESQLVMFYQGSGDAGNKKMSVFSYDMSLVCAAHSRVTLQSEGSRNTCLAVDAYSGDSRAYISAYDLDRLVKWLKSLPKGSVYLNWVFDDNGVEPTFYASFSPDRSVKDFKPLPFKYQRVSQWIDTFRVPFNQGRCAYKNATNYAALRQFSSFPVRPLVLRWIDEVFEGRGVELVPFDKGNMLYIRSDFRTNMECATCLPYTALSNRQKPEEVL